MSFTEKLMVLEDIVLSDITQTQKKKKPSTTCFLSHEEDKRGESDMTIMSMDKEDWI